MYGFHFHLANICHLSGLKIFSILNILGLCMILNNYWCVNIDKLTLKTFVKIIDIAFLYKRTFQVDLTVLDHFLPEF